NNISNDGSAPGTNPLINKTVTFVNSSASNYLLSPSDTVALDAGATLSADSSLAFATDIAGLSRPQGAAWDIGASEAMASTSDPTEMLTLSFSNVYSAGFTAKATFNGDNNANNSATVYYCDATSTPSCDPLNGSSGAMTRSTGQFIYYAGNLVNPTDSYNVEVIA